MVMTFTSREHFESFDSSNRDPSDSIMSGQAKLSIKNTKFIADKLSVPRLNGLDGYIHRPRLERLLRRALDQVGTVMVTGRAATGKTALVTHFAEKYEKTTWYRIEAADSDWKVFSSYLFAGINENSPPIEEKSVSGFVEKLLGHRENELLEPSLIVLDDIHNVFDTEWFGDFFLTLLYSLSPETHLICLSRSMPALPIWRLRSKQVLSVIDENMLAFNRPEVEEFCKNSGIAIGDAKKLHDESFGRIGKLKTLSDMGS
jgi:LuxR family maltose regulon positive regulatory protein